MSDVIRGSKIIASALLIAGGAISLTISVAIRMSERNGVQVASMVLIAIGVCLFIPAWRGTSGRGRIVRPEHDVDEIVRREVDRMRSLARTAKAKPADAVDE